MSNYRILNTNPDGNDSEDCTVRAISLFLNKPWDDVYWDLSIEGFIMKRILVEDVVWSRYLEKQGSSETWYDPSAVRHVQNSKWSSFTAKL